MPLPLTEDVEIEFTQERFERCVGEAHATRLILERARAAYLEASEALEKARQDAECAKSALRDIAKAAAGYGKYE